MLVCNLVCTIRCITPFPQIRIGSWKTSRSIAIIVVIILSLLVKPPMLARRVHPHDGVRHIPSNFTCPTLFFFDLGSSILAKSRPSVMDPCAPSRLLPCRPTFSHTHSGHATVGSSRLGVGRSTHAALCKTWRTTARRGAPCHVYVYNYVEL
jgi:hypothetical protein